MNFNFCYYTSNNIVIIFCDFFPFLTLIRAKKTLQTRHFFKFCGIFGHFLRHLLRSLLHCRCGTLCGIFGAAAKMQQNPTECRVCGGFHLLGYINKFTITHMPSKAFLRPFKKLVFLKKYFWGQLLLPPEEFRKQTDYIFIVFIHTESARAGALLVSLHLP